MNIELTPERFIEASQESEGRRSARMSQSPSILAK